MRTDGAVGFAALPCFFISSIFSPVTMTCSSGRAYVLEVRGGGLCVGVFFGAMHGSGTPCH